MYEDEEAYEQEIGSVIALLAAIFIFFTTLMGSFALIDHLRPQPPSGDSPQSYDYGFEYYSEDR
jgi:hypothetical protein